MSYTIIRPKDRQEWLTHRTSGIGSSEVATIVGLNPYETPYQLWRRKIGLDSPKEETFAMTAGHYLEPAVAQFWSDATGQEVIKASAGDWLMVNNERPYLRVSPDRTYWLKGQTKSHINKGILECKTTQKAIDPDDLPKHWFCQVQYQLGVAELQHGSLAWLTAGREFGYKDLAFVPDFYEWLIDEVDRFWVDNVQGLQEPIAINASDVLLKYAQHTDGKVIEADTATYEAYSALIAVREDIAALESQKADLENKIKLFIGDAESISYAGQTLATWKAPKPSSKFDAKAFQADHPDLAQPYINTAQGARRFIIKAH